MAAWRSGGAKVRSAAAESKRESSAEMVENEAVGKDRIGYGRSHAEFRISLDLFVVLPVFPYYFHIFYYNHNPYGTLPYLTLQSL